MIGRRAALLLPVLLAGCKLIDQNTFAPPPKPAVVKPAPPAPPPIPPLVTIRFDRPDVTYTDALRQAVTAARSRKVDVAFDIRAVAPTALTLAAQIANINQADADAHGVADAIEKLGVDPSRIGLQSGAEPGITVPEVRVYVH